MVIPYREAILGISRGGVTHRRYPRWQGPTQPNPEGVSGNQPIAIVLDTIASSNIMPIPAGEPAGVRLG